ncbi:hypothetical protein P0Y31_15945 [Knoellia sp. 3-2P3]|uniref:hypothetical protein n=1 Tax=unclassified Knoellia TaxID=2618719 RepID=UPI0023DA8EA7|nr:hypothetical protein [Knoellia sp. 3-2P3]MDF2093842.1 hypothetical protein [Knoellia sp. 3-2P3]
MSDNIPEQDRTKALPTQPTPPAADRTETVPAPTAASATTASATAASRGAGPYAAPEPELVKGPYLAPVILGLVCLLVAAAAFAQELADWSIDWGNVGPLGIVAAGALLVVLGALGLLSSRRRRS